MKIPLGRPYIKTDVVLEEVKKVLESRWISGGPTITEFENRVKEYNRDPDGRYIAVSNGTVAIELALLCINNGKMYNWEDEIIVPSWSWVASGFSPLRVGAKAVWCDVNRYGVPFADDIEKRITKRTKAIIVVHQMGIPVDMDKVNALRDKYNIPIIEDAACAIGSEYKGKRIGHSDNTVTYSFQARKVLTTGEGGMIIVGNEIAEKWLRSYRAFGTNTPPYLRDRSDKLIIEYFDKLGGNYKMSDISAAVGIAHLKYVDEEIDLRTKAAEYYDAKIKELNIKYGGIFIGNPVPEYCTRYNWQNYHIILDKKKYYRDDIIRFLKANGVGCKWDIQATHLEPAISNRSEVLNGTAVFHNGGLWLPFFAEITREEQNYVLQILEEVISAFK